MAYKKRIAYKKTYKKRYGASSFKKSFGNGRKPTGYGKGNKGFITTPGYEAYKCTTEADMLAGGADTRITVNW